MTLETRPRCYICRRPVERIVEEEDTFLRRFRWVVWCHGEIEIVTLTYEELQNMGGGGVMAFGDAFAPLHARSLPRAL